MNIEEIAKTLGPETAWEFKDDKLTGIFRFNDFKEAFAFVQNVAGFAESRNHHPNILIQYNVVTLTLWTHTEGTVTQKDLELAKQIEQNYVGH